MTTVVALGGNALIRAGDRGTAAEQAARLRETADALAPLLRDGNVVITHGNGPQVGNELLRQERSADEVPPLPLYLAVAQTQAEIGSMIETELGPAAGRPVACLLTHVVVEETDPAFERPTKPIGPFYSAEQARALEAEKGLDADAVACVLAAAGRRAAPAPVALPAGLTEREVEVLRLIARGRSNRDVAAELVISPKTVWRHVENLYRKIGARSRAAAAVFAMEHGLLD